MAQFFNTVRNHHEKCYESPVEFQTARAQLISIHLGFCRQVSYRQGIKSQNILKRWVRIFMWINISSHLCMKEFCVQGVEIFLHVTVDVWPQWVSFSLHILLHAFVFTVIKECTEQTAVQMLQDSDQEVLVELECAGELLRDLNNDQLQGYCNHYLSTIHHLISKKA